MLSNGKTRDKINDLNHLLKIFFNAVDVMEKCETKFNKLRVLGDAQS